MRYARANLSSFASVAILATVGLAALIACSTRTPIGGLGDAGPGADRNDVSTGTGSHAGSGGAGTGGGEVIGEGTGGDGSGGLGTGGRVDNTGSGGNRPVVDVCAGATGGAGGRSATAPSFLAPATYAMDGEPFFVTLGDVNGDSQSDLAVSTYRIAGTGGSTGINTGSGGANTGGAGVFSMPGTVNVLINDGKGGFAKAGTYSAITAPIVALGDLDGDAKADLAIALDVSGSVSVLPNKGQGAFGDPVQYSAGVGSAWVAIADLNADGKNDLAVANYGRGEMKGDVAVLLNTGSGTFVAANYATGINPVAVAIGDLNADGRGDLAVANAGGGVSVLLNTGNGAFATPMSYAAGSAPNSIAIGDLNSDGKADVAFATGMTGGGVGILLNLGNGSFGAAILYAGSTGATSLAIADLNADSVPDIALTYLGSACGGLGVLINRGNGTFGAPATFSLPGSPSSVVVGDLNGDAKADVAVANSQSVSIFINSR